jgi:hypothetical protein
MRRTSRTIFGPVLILGFALLSLWGSVNSTPRPKDASSDAKKKEKKEKRKEAAREMKEHEEDGNGIFIYTPEVYDDSSLQMMLNTARARLAALQSFDQAALISRIGAVTGSTLQQSAFAAQISGPPLPQIATTATGPTSSVVTATGAAPSTTTTTTAPSQSAVTTVPQGTAPLVTAPTTTAYTPASTFSISAIDALNEEMQLTYEIANLQLLLEGSLSDRFVRGQRIVKRRTTIGFPITLSPGEKYKDSVAVVEVEVESPHDGMLSAEPPAVTALLPREKTYNVAAITDKTTSIGAGIVTQVVSGGASWTGGRKTYFVVQDQDTVALAEPASDPQSKTAFLWQFRPVLGRPLVRSGLRQTFVQLAVPVNNFAGCFGKVHLKTYWRKYDSKQGVVRRVLADSIRELDVWPIPVFDLAPMIETLAYEDLGGGQIQVQIGGKFLSGTYIRVGNGFYRDGVVGFTSEASQLRFIAPAADIAIHRAYIVGRDGTEIEILHPIDPEPRDALSQGCGDEPAGTKSTPTTTTPAATAPTTPSDNKWTNPAKVSVAVSSFDESNVFLEVKAVDLPHDGSDPSGSSYYLVVGNRMFGLTDSSFERTVQENEHSVTYRVVVPIALLVSAREVEIEPLFRKTGKYRLRAKVDVFSLSSGSEKLVMIEKNDQGARFVLMGNRLKNATVLAPSGLSLKSLQGVADEDSIRQLEIKTDQLKTTKQILLLKATGERPIFVSVPSSEEKGSSQPGLVVKGRITIGTDEATVSGDGLEKLKAVLFKKKPIPFTLSDDKKSVTLKGLAAAGVTAVATEQELDCEFVDGKKSTVKIDVVSSKIETIDRNKN